jgi:two-component system sensor histidine kinase/response regulator
VPNAPLDPVKFLLVDDLEDNLVALSALLRRPDLELELYMAGSGTEALELLLQHDFALAIIDVHMPHMDGFELAELLRGTERCKHLPIIFATAAPREQHRVFKGYESGVTPVPSIGACSSCTPSPICSSSS